MEGTAFTVNATPDEFKSVFDALEIIAAHTDASWRDGTITNLPEPFQSYVTGAPIPGDLAYEKAREIVDASTRRARLLATELGGALFVSMGRLTTFAFDSLNLYYGRGAEEAYSDMMSNYD